jgi:type I restriction enzyme S subunit
MGQVLYKLPDGWSWKKLSDLAKTTSGGTPSRSNKDYWGGSIPWVKSGELGDSKVEKNEEFITELGLKNSSAKLFPKESLLLALYGATAGKLGVLTYDAATNQAVCCISQDDRLLKRDFLRYYLLSQRKKIIEDSFGGAQPNISQAYVREIDIPTPPITEQTRIVEKLDALLTRIDTAIEHLQESVTLKSSLLQSALDGQFAAIADRMSIESLAEVKGGKRLPKGEKLSDDVTDHPYIRVADFTDKGTIDLSGIKYISKEIHEQIKRYVISKDDLYISIAGTIGKTGFVPPELDGANLTENAAKLVIKDKQQLDLSYLYLFTLTSDFSAQAGLATKTVAQPKLALTRLSKIEIPMCSLEEQKALVTTIEALKSKIHDAEAVLLGKIEDLKNLKASILDSAFKGQL